VALFLTLWPITVTYGTVSYLLSYHNRKHPTLSTPSTLGTSFLQEFEFPAKNFKKVTMFWFLIQNSVCEQRKGMGLVIYPGILGNNMASVLVSSTELV
jgi:hypothetical protein